MSRFPVVQSEFRRSSRARRLGELVRSVGRGLGLLCSRCRQKARQVRQPVPLGGVFASFLGRAIAGKSGSGRMLEIEERLALGPRKYLYLVRCGDERLLVASSGEAALECLALPCREGSLEALPGSAEQPRRALRTLDGARRRGRARAGVRFARREGRR